MKLDFSNERVLAIVAHPDDAELLCAGTLARAKVDGAAIGICVMCQGDKGQSSHQGQPMLPIDELAAKRRTEMRQAADVLGSQLFLGEASDSTLVDSGPMREMLIRILREFRPTLLLAHAETDYHTDHRAVSQLAETCSWLCASNGQPVSGEPLDEPPAVWWMDTVGMQQFVPSLFVDISEFVDIKEQMLACHETQLDRSGDADFTPLRDLMRTQMHTRGRQADVTAAEAFRPHQSFKRTRAW